MSGYPGLASSKNTTFFSMNYLANKIVELWQRFLDYLANDDERFY